MTSNATSADEKLDNQKKLEVLNAHSDEMEKEKCTPEKESLYTDAGYNRNKTLIAQYVNRILPDFPTPTERYYDIRFISAINRSSFFGPVGDQCIMFHSNRICVLTLAPTHPVIAEDKTITKVEFTFEGHEKIDRLSSKPKGKHKRGGQKLRKNSPVCALICSDDSKYIITACIGSRLIEINEAIASNFNLIKTRPLSTGFIAIVQPNEWRRLDEIKASYPKLGQDMPTLCEEEVDE